jgi:hypothetical protein
MQGQVKNPPANPMPGMKSPPNVGQAQGIGQLRSRIAQTPTTLARDQGRSFAAGMQHRMQRYAGSFIWDTTTNRPTSTINQQPQRRRSEMRRYLVLSIVALITASLNGITWADMGEMGGMAPAAAPAAAPATDSGTMKDMGAMMGDMSSMMKGMSRVMQHEPMRDETKMKHMGAMMRDMSDMAKGMSGTMGSGTMKDDQMAKHMGMMMNDMSAMMQSMSEAMGNGMTAKDETKMKHMSAMMRDMSSMMEGMGDKMGSGAMTKDEMMKDDEMIKKMKTGCCM